MQLKKISDFWAIKDVVKHITDIWNSSQNLCKSSKCSETLSHHSSPDISFSESVDKEIVVKRKQKQKQKINKTKEHLTAGRQSLRYRGTYVMN